MLKKVGVKRASIHLWCENWVLWFYRVRVRVNDRIEPRTPPHAHGTHSLTRNPPPREESEESEEGEEGEEGPNSDGCCNAHEQPARNTQHTACPMAAVASAGMGSPVVHTDAPVVHADAADAAADAAVKSAAGDGARIFQPPIAKSLGEPIISVRDLSKSYQLPGREEPVRALHEIQLCDDAATTEFYSVRKGEFVMIRGPSGGGKTSLLNCIGLIDRPSTGTVSLLGKQIDLSTASDDVLSMMRLERIGFVFQTFNLLATFTALENVELPMSILAKRTRKEMRARAKLLLTLVGLQDRMDHLPSELSGGEQQRVTIARSLANDPDILLLDEPTGDLDTRNTIDIMNLLLEVNQKARKTLIMVTHNPDLELYADRILYVKDGRFVRQALNGQQCQLDYALYKAHLDSKQKDE